VADYLSMLDAELRGAPFNKTAHRRALSAALNQRSDGPIERKHQNISAILIELGYPYVSGYKPLGNYQSLLFDVVKERVTGDRELLALFAHNAMEPAVVPTVDNILGRLEERPEPTAPRYGRVAERDGRELRVTGTINYLEREARNSSLGRAGEEFVIEFERARLIAHGENKLADRVDHASRTKGDGLGFDIHSFDVDGRDRLIEVKTTGYGKATPFFVSRNELRVSQAQAELYHLYRVFQFRSDPRLYSIKGSSRNWVHVPWESAFDLEDEVVVVAEAIGHALDDLDLVVHAFETPGVDRISAVIDDALGMPTEVPGERPER